MESAEDPELLFKHCEPVSDAEMELEICPFVHEYDGSPQTLPSVAVTPSQPTGILVLSISSTDSDGQSSARENEEFPIQPVQNNSSQPYFPGSVDRKSSTSAAGNRDNTEVIDLGSDSDDLGFTNQREIEKQPQKRKRVSEEDLDKTHQSQQVDKEVMECEENVQAYERRMGRNADSSTAKMCERGDGGEVSEKNADSSSVKMSERGEQEGDGGEAPKNGVGAASVEGRRKLPKSMMGGEKNDGVLEELVRRLSNYGRFKDLMGALCKVVGDVSSEDDKNGADFFETAKRRGMTFPRPRWWPPEGFSD